jgi:hypothetical protein
MPGLDKQEFWNAPARPDLAFSAAPADSGVKGLERVQHVGYNASLYRGQPVRIFALAAMQDAPAAALPEVSLTRTT